MTSEVAIAASISSDMRQAAKQAASSAGQLAGMDLRNQWESRAADQAQRILQSREQEMSALAQAAAATTRLAEQATRSLLALQQTGKL
ncbi:hypothetical protein [uncultured Varibaculum sp.]|uniref:hypothetical protein n=1 Tax=uncultured Varibaculum sp. TaxID=413896 RepID=UPI002594225E|nr:hypothetical protein [uncultured Varibaculum sp.]